MENTLILCHFNNQLIDLWTNCINKKQTFPELNNLEFLLDNFIKTLNRLESPVCFSFESESDLTRKLISQVKNKKELIPFSHELLILKNLFKTDSVQSVYYIDSIFPMLDSCLSEKLLQIHQEYLADYSFIENSPPGINGVFFSRSLFDAMEIEKNENTDKIEIDNSIPDSLNVPLKNYIEKNINQFHVEIHFEHPDLRLLRLDFSCKTPRSILLSQRFLLQQPDPENPYGSLENIINKDPQILHKFPSYFELEVNGSCEYNCAFCPRTSGEKKDSDKLSLDDIKLLIEYSSKGLDDTVFTLGGLGEPLEHPDILQILNLLLNNPVTPVVILETNGKYLDKILPILENKNLEKLKIILNINSLKSYETIHGTTLSNKEKVLKNIEDICKAFGEKNSALKKNIFIQTLKITDNETELDEIFNLTDSLGISFLLQKYNSYAHLMPEKRVSDMTPLERSFCWHLRRDMFIRADGNVVFCKQDIKNQAVRGNIKNSSLADIWSLIGKDWQNNYNNQFPSKPDCEACDEYYTFNM